MRVGLVNGWSVVTLARMATTLDLDEDLLREAKEAMGVADEAELIHLALKNLLAREAARRLAAMGGSAPGIEEVPRRRAG